jgi:hypothetical protein
VTDPRTPRTLPGARISTLGTLPPDRHLLLLLIEELFNFGQHCAPRFVKFPLFIEYMFSFGQGSAVFMTFPPPGAESGPEEGGRSF